MFSGLRILDEKHINLIRYGQRIEKERASEWDTSIGSLILWMVNVPHDYIYIW